MADVSGYLFWAGLALACAAAFAHLARALGTARAGAMLTAETGYGTVTVRAPGPERRRALPAAVPISFGALATAALGAMFASRWAAVGHAPFGNLYEFTTAFAFGIGAAHLSFAAWTRSDRFGLLAWPIAAGMLAIASTFPSEIVPLVPALQDNLLLSLHVAAMMTAYAVITVSFCAAVVYLAQGGPGRRRFAWLPGPGAAEELAHRSVVVGFPVLGLGIALGAFWANNAWGRYWGWDPKETSALVTWLAMAAYFHARAGTGTVAAAPVFRRLLPARMRRGWRPNPMWWLVLTWGLVMFTYFGVNLWISGLHSYAGV